jgi:23S rRNA (pseudouridine1915-N3)-methyltransferase
MRITLHCIGKIDKSSPELALIERYKARIPWLITIKEFDLKKNLPDEQRKEAESLLLLSDIPKNNKIILLDERGKTPSTVVCSHVIKRFQEQGYSEFTFLIGGAAGHGTTAKQQADYTLSLGAMTWPHMLVRSMLIEQIYRLYTLSTGHPYHK